MPPDPRPAQEEDEGSRAGPMKRKGRLKIARARRERRPVCVQGGRMRDVAVAMEM